MYTVNNSPNRNKAGNTALKLVLRLLVVLALAGSVYGTYLWQHQEVDRLDDKVSQLNTDLDASKKNQTPVATDSYTSPKGVVVKVYVPARNSQLASPVIVMGEVPGNWSFEASFPVKLLDANGKVVAETTAHLLGDWMTDKLVPFTAKLTYTKAMSGTGTLMLQKDNPSGIASNNDSVSIELKF